jgi:hypothetical protein
MDRDEVRARGETREQLFEELHAVREQVGERAAELRRTMMTMADEHPLLTVGAAFGIGYLLSGAIYSRTTARLVGIGARFLFGAMMRDAIAGAVMPNAGGAR